MTLGTSKCSCGRPRGGRDGLQVGVAAEDGLGDSATSACFDSVDISTLSREVPILGRAASPSKVKSTKPPSLPLRVGDEDVNCCECVLSGGGL